MFWNRKKDDDEQPKLPDGFELPDGITEGDIESAFVVQKPEDLDELPHEMLLALTKSIMGEHSKLLVSGHALSMALMTTLVQLYGTALKTEMHIAAERLKSSLDVLGSFMVTNGFVTAEEFEEQVQIGIDIVTGKVPEGEAAVEEYNRRRAARAGGAPQGHRNGKVEGHAPREEIERARKVNDLFGAALNPNSNRAKRADDAF